MKIAYLILAHNQFMQLERLVNSLLHPGAEIFIHVDKRAKFDKNEFQQSNVHILENRISVHWGGFSIIAAQIELIKKANELGRYDYYILLSGADYPIKTHEQLVQYLIDNEGSNFINTIEMPQFNKPFDRIRTFYLEGGERSEINLKTRWISMWNRVFKKMITNRKLPSPFTNYKLYAGGQWWVFHDAFIQYLLLFLEENKQLVRFYKHTFIPDEMFFHTILMNSHFSHTQKGSLTYTDWRLGEPPHPSLINHIHMAEINIDYSETAYGISYHCFARKFNDQSQEIINSIEAFKSNSNKRIG